MNIKRRLLSGSSAIFALASIGLGAVVCNAQSLGQAQSGAKASTAAPAYGNGEVLEIAPQPEPAAPAPAPAAPAGRRNQSGGENPSGAANDIELYRTYSDSEHAAGHTGPLPYLGISVHSTTVMQPNGVQRQALEVLGVDKGSPAALAGIQGSGAPTKLGASTLTAGALLGPAQELIAPLLNKTGQLGRQGDLIVAADDNRVGTEQDLAGELARLKPGDTLWLTILRESPAGKPRAVKVPIKLAAPDAASASR